MHISYSNFRISGAPSTFLYNSLSLYSIIQYSVQFQFTMYLPDNTEDLEAQLCLLDSGRIPEYSGPTRLHGVWARNRRRLIVRKLKKQKRRAARWLPQRKPRCKGPSALQVLLANIQSYFLLGALGLALIWFVLWYFGIWTYIVWLCNAIWSLISGIVSYL
jgi:hypothetical protein